MRQVSQLSFWVVVSVLLVLSSLPSVLADEVVLKDGSKIIGEIQSMEGKSLHVKTVFNKDVVIDWEQVATLKTEKPMPFAQADGTILQGTAGPGANGQLAITAAGIQAPAQVTLASITAINPAPKPYMTVTGFLQIGAIVNDGNTQNRSFQGSGELEARTEITRFNVRGLYNYAQANDGELTARNAQASTKFDYFFTKRAYGFVSALFQGDEFQDLRLRTALSAGPGYQVIEKGDFAGPNLTEMELFAEAGISYFDEDFDSSPDSNYAAARWSVKLNWPLYEKKIVVFHFHEGFPGLEDAKDLFVTTEQGVRLKIFDGFFAALQVNWRWDSTPAPGRERDDTVYLFNLGFNFERAVNR